MGERVARRFRGRLGWAVCLAAGLALLIVAPIPGLAGAHAPHKAYADAKIHVMSQTYSDCIILESNGLFGMVDAGEDLDYPDGSDSRYPLRSGINTEDGYDEQVFAYLDELGVNHDNFVFFMGTHPHSDHIGLANEVIERYQPQRVYLGKYSDSMIGYEPALWDNQYVYDQAVEAANLVGAELIQQVSDTVIAKHSAHFTLGDMQLTIENHDHDFSVHKALDANDMSWGLLVEAYGQRAFLSGDINNYLGDEDYLAQTLGHVDYLKLGHHANDGSNTDGYLDALTPTYAIQTGQFELFSTRTLYKLNDLGTHIYTAQEALGRGYQATVATLGEGGISFNTHDDDMVYRHHDTGTYMYCYQDGLPVVAPRGWVEWSGYYFWFDGQSTSAAVSQWVQDEGNWYYVDEYSCRATGWRVVDHKWYYFSDDGVMQHDTWVDNSYLRSDGALEVNPLSVGPLHSKARPGLDMVSEYVRTGTLQPAVPHEGPGRESHRGHNRGGR